MPQPSAYAMLPQISLPSMADSINGQPPEGQFRSLISSRGDHQRTEKEKHQKRESKNEKVRQNEQLKTEQCICDYFKILVKQQNSYMDACC